MSKIRNWSKTGDNEWYNKNLNIWLRIGNSDSLRKPEPPYYLETKFGKKDGWRLIGNAISTKRSAKDEAVLHMVKYNI